MSFFSNIYPQRSETNHLVYLEGEMVPVDSLGLDLTLSRWSSRGGCDQDFLIRRLFPVALPWCKDGGVPQAGWWAWLQPLVRSSNATWSTKRSARQQLRTNRLQCLVIGLLVILLWGHSFNLTWWVIGGEVILYGGSYLEDGRGRSWLWRRRRPRRQRSERREKVLKSFMLEQNKVGFPSSTVLCSMLKSKLLIYLVHLGYIDDRAILCKRLNSREGNGGKMRGGVWPRRWVGVGAAAGEVMVGRGGGAGDVEQVRQVGQASAHQPPMARPQLTPALPDHPLIRSIQSNWRLLSIIEATGRNKTQ